MQDPDTSQIDFRKRLESRWIDSRRRNPSFSLRAFSKKIGISSSALSEILNGKRRVSRKMVLRIAERLAFDHQEINEMLRLFPDTSSASAKRLKETLSITVDQHRLISEWYHFAILNLLKLPDFKNDNEWIGNRLGITGAEAKAAIERLMRLDLLNVLADGSLKRAFPNLSTPDNVKSHSLKKAHLRNFTLATESLLKDPIEKRDFTATTFVLDPRRLPELQAMIRRFHKRLCSYFEKGSVSEVYKISIQCFPLSKSGGLTRRTTQ